jgi:hypothetical protein
MANLYIPEEERNLSPAEIEALDKRRQWGLTLQVIGGQFAFFAVLLTLWSGQDVTYSPPGIHPMFYYNILAVVLAVVFGGWGTLLKRGRPEFQSW